jgi:hypothetical protein
VFELERPPDYALSIKQPWATLVLHGLKTIEIRRWPTTVRGLIYIHTGAISDDREEGWRAVPEHLRKMAKLRGGLVGTVNLTECLKYSSVEEFRTDIAHHRNELSWFRPPFLYGFRFKEPKVVPFRRHKGWIKFFRDEPEVQPSR